MTIHRLREEKVQDKMRVAFGEVMMKNGLFVKDLAKEVGVSGTLMVRFLARTRKFEAALPTLIRMTHYLTKHNYDVTKFFE